MDPTFHLAERYSQAALHRRALSALPDAPVRPTRDKPRRRWRFPHARRRWFALRLRRPASVECMPTS
jgi:hypothetical protein